MLIYTSDHSRRELFIRKIVDLMEKHGGYDNTTGENYFINDGDNNVYIYEQCEPHHPLRITKTRSFDPNDNKFRDVKGSLKHTYIFFSNGAAALIEEREADRNHNFPYTYAESTGIEFPVRAVSALPYGCTEWYEGTEGKIGLYNGTIYYASNRNLPIVWQGCLFAC